jgi:uncharacterized protein
LNVRYVFVAGLSKDLQDWAATIDGARYMPASGFSMPAGVALYRKRACFDRATDFPDSAWLRTELESGRIKVFGELVPQFMGLSPQDSRLETYWKRAEEFDIPDGIHMGPRPPGAAYDSSPAPAKPEFRMAMGNPMVLEEVLLRHKRLRLFVMHAGWPWLDSMLALLYAHPNAYVDTAGVSADFMVPRASNYRHLCSLVEAGFGKRIMFGSDFPNQVGPGIDAIGAADFLTATQKADILCNNAARFLRLPTTTCRPG